MAKKFLTHLNLNKNELQNAVLQRLSSDPDTPVEGQIYYNTASDTIKFYDGAGWISLPSDSAGGVKITIDDSAPTVNNDETEDYDVGSLWINNTTGDDKPIFYIATDVTEGSAEWVAFNATTFHSADPTVSDTSYPNGHLWVNTTDNTAFIKAGLDDTDAVWKEVAGTPSLGSDDISNDSSVVGSTVSDALETLDGELDSKADQSYVDGIAQGISWKNPVRVATTANINLTSELENGDTIDGVELVTGDRVLVKNQSTESQNGIYVVPASGAASRSADANASAELRFAVVGVEQGSTQANTAWVQTTDDIDLGTSNIVFVQFHFSDIPSATTDVAGKVELATEAETAAKNDTTRAVTPSGLASFPRKFAANVGNNSSTTIAVTHNFNSEDVLVEVYENSSKNTVECDVTRNSVNQVTLGFTVAPNTDALRVVVIG